MIKAAGSTALQFLSKRCSICTGSKNTEKQSMFMQDLEAAHPKFSLEQLDTGNSGRLCRGKRSESILRPLVDHKVAVAGLGSD